MTLRLNGATSGSVSLDAPATGSNVSLELPTDSIKPGLVLVASQSFSAASSVSVNNCFTATYDNYRIACSYSPSTNGTTHMRFRAGGSDITTSNYEGRGVDVGALTASTYAGATAHEISSNGVSGNGFMMDVINPQRTDFTHNFWDHIRLSVGAFATWRGLGGTFSATTAFDGFTIYPASGTITGSIRIYGYRNSL